MTAQNTHASISQNSFGTGAKINLVVGTSSKMGKKSLRLQQSFLVSTMMMMIQNLPNG